MNSEDFRLYEALDRLESKRLIKRAGGLIFLGPEYHNWKLLLSGGTCISNSFAINSNSNSQDFRDSELAHITFESYERSAPSLSKARGPKGSFYLPPGPEGVPKFTVANISKSLHNSARNSSSPKIAAVNGWGQNQPTPTTLTEFLSSYYLDEPARKGFYSKNGNVKGQELYCHAEQQVPSGHVMGKVPL
jgi:hypothetical protein